MKRQIVFLIVLSLLFSFDAMAQKPGKKYTITGQVIDVNDKPLSGAIVLIDDKNTEVVTDDKGMYKIKVKNNAEEITVFKPQNGTIEEEIKGRTVINIRLPAENPLLATKVQVNSENDDVNVGYGRTAKKDLTTNVSKISGEKKDFVAYQSIYEMLQRDPSVQLNGKKITIRGIDSIYNTDPLLVVDGMIVQSIDDISPQTVKSIEILKGSDAAIYGSRGGNGVILITLIH